MFDMNPDNTWQQILKVLREKPATEAAVDPWLAPLVPVSLSEVSFILAAQTDIAKSFIMSRYKAYIDEAAKQVVGRDIGVEIISISDMPGPAVQSNPVVKDDAPAAEKEAAPVTQEPEKIYIDEFTEEN